MKRAKKSSFNVIFILFCLVLGMLMGWISKDYINYGKTVSAIIQNLGIWVFVSSLIAYFSQDAVKGAVHNFTYLIGVIAAYYVHHILLGKEVVLSTIIFWLVFALIGALFGFIVHNSRAKEWLGAICASVPVAVLISEGYQVYQTRTISLALDIVFAIVLYILLAPGKYQKLMALPFIIVIVFALVYFNVLSSVFGGWI